MTRKSGDLPFPVTSRYTRGMQARTSVTVALIKCCRMRIAVFKLSLSCGLYNKQDKAASHNRPLCLLVAGHHDTQRIAD